MSGSAQAIPVIGLFSTTANMWGPAAVSSSVASCGHAAASCAVPSSGSAWGPPASSSEPRGRSANASTRLVTATIG